jgi:hypothetical protein
MSRRLGSSQQPMDQGRRQDQVVDKVVRITYMQIDTIFND